MICMLKFSGVKCTDVCDLLSNASKIGWIGWDGNRIGWMVSDKSNITTWVKLR